MAPPPVRHATVVKVRPENWQAEPEVWDRPSAYKDRSLVFDAGGAVLAEALFLEYREASGEILTPELFCGPMSPRGCVRSRPSGRCQSILPTLMRVRTRGSKPCRKISPALAVAPIKACQACFRPVTEDGLPFYRPRSGCCDDHWKSALNGPATGEAMSELLLDGGRGTSTSRHSRPFERDTPSRGSSLPRSSDDR